jgi:hypothetical protein
MQRTEDCDDVKTLSFLSYFLRETKLSWSRFIFCNRSLVPTTPAARLLPLTLRTGSMKANNGGNFFVFSALRVLETRICRRQRIGLLFILHASEPYTTLRRKDEHTIGNVCLDSTTKSLWPRPYCLLMGRELPA